MNARNDLSKFQKFTLPLKSKTEKKRISEAQNALVSLYPFKIERSNIFILRTDKKGLFDIYITDHKIKNHRHKLLIILAISAVFIISITVILIERKELLKNRAIYIEQKEKELKEQEEIKIQKEKIEKLNLLKTEYDEKKENQYEKIYPYIERIYSVMSENTTIENIIIQRNSFSVEVTTNDAMKILELFEESGAFNSIKMNRTTINNKTETVNYNGEFSRNWKHAEQNLSLDEKISFYSKEIEKIENRHNNLNAIPLSEYIKKIRDSLHKNGCAEQYIQLRENATSVEIEFFILSSSRNILTFINEIQSEADNLIDIKQLHIRNSEERSRIQTTICFTTESESEKIIEEFKEYEEHRIPAAEIDKVFYKASGNNKNKVKVMEEKKINKSSLNQNSLKPELLKELLYIGITKSEDTTYVIAKDEEMESIYKFILTSEEKSGDFCIETTNGYKAKIRDDYYEVRK